MPQQEYILPLLPGLTGTLIPPDTPVPGGAASLGHCAGNPVPIAAVWMELILRADHTPVRTSSSQVGLREGLSISMSYKFGRSRQNAQTALFPKALLLAFLVVIFPG